MLLLDICVVVKCSLVVYLKCCKQDISILCHIHTEPHRTRIRTLQNRQLVLCFSKDFFYFISSWYCVQVNVNVDFVLSWVEAKTKTKKKRSWEMTFKQNSSWLLNSFVFLIHNMCVKMCVYLRFLLLLTFINNKQFPFISSCCRCQ